MLLCNALHNMFCGSQHSAEGDELYITLAYRNPLQTATLPASVQKVCGSYIRPGSSESWKIQQVPLLCIYGDFVHELL